MFEVILSPQAQAFFVSADKPLAKKLSRCFSELERDPRRHNNIKRLTGKPGRVGVPAHRVRWYRELCARTTLTVGECTHPTVYIGSSVSCVVMHPGFTRTAAPAFE